MMKICAVVFKKDGQPRMMLLHAFSDEEVRDLFESQRIINEGVIHAETLEFSDGGEDSDGRRLNWSITLSDVTSSDPMTVFQPFHLGGYRRGKRVPKHEDGDIATDVTR